MFVIYGVPFLPPGRPVGANYQIDIPPGFKLAGSTRPAGHLSRNKVEVRRVGFMRAQVS